MKSGAFKQQYKSRAGPKAGLNKFRPPLLAPSCVPAHSSIYMRQTSRTRNARDTPPQRAMSADARDDFQQRPARGLFFSRDEAAR